MKRISILTLLIGFYSLSFSQTIDDSTKKKIDELFTQWVNPKSPGGAIGIVRNDSLIYAKGFGMANLENNIPNTTETNFYMASVSKQFTGYCIVLLAKQGKVKLEEDIRIYLPWFPNYGDKITVRNLLNHTSGIRDDLDLATISGLNRFGMVTQLHALSLIKSQRSLNFTPGKQHQYSNSNFVLLAEIVETVSGQSFSSFADSAIFKPLGMNHTSFPEDYTKLISNRANSYSKINNSSFTNNFQNVYTLGDGGMFSNIVDMQKWVSNFFNPKVGNYKDIEQLTQKGRLNNGNEIFYALGVNVTTLKGWNRYHHRGSMAGYGNYVAIYPNLKLGIIVFGNVNSNPAPRDMVVQINDLLIKDNPTVKNVTIDEKVAV
ncbi:MAG: beta-lactamase family protein, partial [Ferruginibacter sp.]|nr:beta-lactamase family protein [Ferruginibacter sp.]